MKIASQIVQQHLMSELEKFTNLDTTIFNEIFWKNFTILILSFEVNPRALYKLVLSLDVDTEIIEKLISEIPLIFSILLSELAEGFSKGHTSEATNILLNSKEKTFKEEVDFFLTLNKAVNIIERQRIKSELPYMFEKLQNKYLEGEI
jgi:hypothetical protein